MQGRKLNCLYKVLVGLFIVIIVCLVDLNVYKVTKANKSNTTEIKEDYKEDIEEKKQPVSKRMSIVMVGDALIHGAIYMDAKKGKDTYDFTSMFTDIEPMIKNYDLRYYNQESIIGGKKIGLSHYPRLNSPEEIGENLVSIGFNLVSLANNHSFDRGEVGLQNSLAFWKSQEGVKTAGSYRSFEEQSNIPVYEQNGIKYAFLAYTMSTNGLSAPKGKEYYVNVYDKTQVKNDVVNARNKGAEVVIVSMHWGNEYTHIPTSIQKETATYLSDLGVNLIIGSHPHVIQPMEYINDTLVIYSLGNFISAQRILGQEKVIGLLVGTDIIVEENKVTFDKTNFELLYTYYTSSNTKFKVIPFSKLNNNMLKNYESINLKYRKIVDPEGIFNGNKK